MTCCAVCREPIEPSEYGWTNCARCPLVAECRQDADLHHDPFVPGWADRPPTVRAEQATGVRCHACGYEMTLDQWGHPVHPGRCVPVVKVTDPGGECLHCRTFFPTGHGLLIHTSGSCTADNPRPPKVAPRTVKACPTCSLRHFPRCATTRYPIEPLLAVRPASALNLEAWPGTSGKEIQRGHANGLPFWIADRWALRAGYHPADIWPSWFDDGLSVVDRQKADGGWRHVWLASLIPDRERVAA